MKKTLTVLLVFLITFSTIAVFSPKVNAQDTSQQLTTNSYEDKHPSWNPDGTRMAWVAYEGSWYRHVWVMNSDGTGKTQLTSGSIVDEWPIYSPDGSKIVFQRWGFRGDRFDLMIMDSDGSNVQRITFDSIPGKAEGTFHESRWSEDGSKIVCQYGEGTTGGVSAWWIVTMSSDGTNIEVIGRGIHPQYVFGDGKILFNSGDPILGDERIALMNLDGTGVEYLTDGPYDWRPHMSSISHRIVFNRGSGIAADLYIMNQDGSDLHPFINDGQNRKAEWSPDEEYIAYTSGKSGNYDIWKIGAPSAKRVVGYWKFDEGFGTVASDSSGNGNTGTLMNGPQWVDGVIGKALKFDGIDDYLSASDSPSLDVSGNQITVMFWMRPTVDIDASTSYQKLYDKGDAYHSAIGGGGMRFTIAYVHDIDSVRKTWSGNTWYHVAHVYNGSTISIYVDGVLDNSELETGSIHVTSLPFTIAAYTYGGKWYFPGTIDEFRIYDYALTTEEIWNDYTRELCTLPWKDDFDYETKDDMKAAGWILSEEERISVGGGVVTLENDGEHGSGVRYVGHFPSGIYDFSVEAKSRWIGRAYGQRCFYVWTQRHRYCWYGDGYYPEYAFIRDDIKAIRFGGYSPIMNTWATFTLEKRGNTFYMYEDGDLKNTYTETDEVPDEMIGVSISCGWTSTMEYDYISVEIPSAVRVWKDETSFGLENDHLKLEGDYSHYNHGTPWFNYLLFKDTGTTWTSPWDDIIRCNPNTWYATGSVNVEAEIGTEDASITLTYSIVDASKTLTWTAEFWITTEAYVRIAMHATNTGSQTSDPISLSLGYYTYIAGDSNNDYYYVPGFGQGQYTGTQECRDYTPTEPWMAAWDQNKEEGVGVVFTEGYSFPPDYVRLHDWYGLTAVAQGGWGYSETQPLEVGEASQDYQAYLYFFTGTGWQKTKEFYKSVRREFDPMVDGFKFANAPDVFMNEWCKQNTEEYLENLRATIESKYPDLYTVVSPLQNEHIRNIFYSTISTFVAYLHTKGHCRGMTETAKQFFLGEQTLPAGISKTYDLERPRMYTTYAEYLQKLIDDNQNSVADPYIFVKCMNLWVNLISQREEYEAVKAYVSTGIPALVSLRPTTGVFPHSVLAYKVDDATKNISIYDPNAPGKYKFLEFEEIAGSLVMKEYDPWPDYNLKFDRMAFTEVPDNVAEVYEYILSYLNNLFAIFVKCPTELHVYDAERRFTGVDADQNAVCEIPNSIYIGSQNCSQTVFIHNPSLGQYDINVVALEECTYEMTLCLITEPNIKVRAFLSEIDKDEVQQFSADVSENELTFHSWEYVFEDAKRGTILKISTDDQYFQFIAPDKTFSVIYDPDMSVHRHVIVIRYNDTEIKLYATAVDSKIDFCIAYAKDMQTGKTYWLIDKPKWRGGCPYSFIR